MSSHDWSQFLLRIPIKADKKEIYKAWTTQQGLESWFLRSSQFKTSVGKKRDGNNTIEQGDTYEWYWHGWGDEMVEKGAILGINANSLKFSFGSAGNVTVTIEEELGDTILELKQSDIPTDENSQINYYIGCSKGWQFYLTNLKSILEGGLDLRNKKVELKNVITA